MTRQGVTIEGNLSDLPAPQIAPGEEITEVLVEATPLMDWPRFLLIVLIGIAILSLMESPQ